EIQAAEIQGTVRLGRYEFPKATVEFQPMFPMANLGSRVLRDFRVTFDQKNGRMRIVRGEEEQPGDADDEGVPRAARTLRSPDQRDATRRSLVLDAEQVLGDRDLDQQVETDRAESGPARARRSVDHGAAGVGIQSLVARAILAGVTSIQLESGLPRAAQR